MKHIFFILLLTSNLAGQESDNIQLDHKVNHGKTNIYTDAVTHYIDSVYYKDKPIFDTLFVLKNGDLEKNIFPVTVKNVLISFLDTVNMYRRFKSNTQIRALTISSDLNVGKDRVNVLIISFVISLEKRFVPTRSCRIRYYFNHTKKEFEFHNIACDLLKV